MAIQETSSKILIVILILIELARSEHNDNQPIRRFLTKRHHEKDFPPRLTHQLPGVRAKPHEPQAFECPVEARPEGEVKWFKDGQVLASEPAHLEQTGRELMFFQLNDADAGDYHCEADNYLGRVASEPFRLTVQSSVVQDENILLEPLVNLAADQQDWPAEFRCTMPTPLLGRVSKLWQTSRPEQFVKWQRNGRPLPVVWADNRMQQQQRPSSSSGWARFVARQGEQAPNEFLLSVERPNRQQDNNSTFTCQLKWDSEVELGAEEAHESRPALLKFEAGPAAPAKRPVKLDTTMADPIADIARANPANDNTSNSSSNNNLLTMQMLDANRSRNDASNYTTQLQDGTRQQAPNRIRTSLSETLSDLYQIAKPTLILFGVMSLVAVIVLFQFLVLRRRAQAVHRYMKHSHHNHHGHGHNHHHHHHQYSSSASSSAASQAGAGGSGASSALSDCDPVLSSLLARTLSAPSASSLSGGAAGKKYKYYRDHMRGGKVAAAPSHEQQLVDGAAQHDFIDATAYFAANQLLQQQQPDFQPTLFTLTANANAAVPNLYNQSLAAREQARSLLQAGEHVRSMGNLASSGQHHRLEHQLSKQHELIMSSSGAQNQRPLELPVNFANSYQTLGGSGGPLESGAAALLNQQQQQQQQTMWPNQHHQLLLAAANHHQQQKQPVVQAKEQYQLVSCSSVSPSSTSSIVAGSNSSATTAAMMPALEETPANQRLKSTAHHHHQQLQQQHSNQARDSVSNHYSIIENNDDDEAGHVTDETDVPQRQEEEEERYEELDDRNEFRRSSARSSLASTTGQRRRDGGGSNNNNNKRDFNLNTSFGMGAQAKQANAANGKRHNNLFGSKRTNTTKNGKTNQQHKLSQDQLSPYAVSLICQTSTPPSPPPPPVSSEAIRALNEQFDINQLVMIDAAAGGSNRLAKSQFEASPPRIPFDLPPPPPPPSSASIHMAEPELTTSTTMTNTKDKNTSDAQR